MGTTANTAVVIFSSLVLGAVVVLAVLMITNKIKLCQTSKLSSSSSSCPSPVAKLGAGTVSMFGAKNVIDNCSCKSLACQSSTCDPVTGNCQTNCADCFQNTDCPNSNDACVSNKCVCQPSKCVGECGGDDGCGVQCPACTRPNDACIGNQCVCQPACEFGTCGGDDGCGGVCACTQPNEVCKDGKCVVPTPVIPPEEEEV